MSNRLLYLRQGCRGAPVWPFALNRASPQARGLVEVFPFWEGAGAKLHGLAGSGIEGTFEGPPTWTVHPVFGRPALDFTGNSETDRVNLGNVQHPRLSFDWDRPWSFWLRCRPDGFAADDGCLFGKWGSTQQRQVLLRIDQGSGNTELRAGNITIFTGSAVTAGHDLVYAVVNDGSKTAAGVRIYVYDLTTRRFIEDGANPTSAPTDANDQSAVCTLGRTIGNSDEFDGLMDELRFYDVALTRAEILHSLDPATRWDLYRETRVPPVWPAAAGGAVTHTRVASLQAALRLQTSFSALTDAALQAESVLSALAGAALQDEVLRNASLDLAAQALMEAQTELDSALRTAFDLSAGLDASLTAEGLSQRAAALDGAVRRLKLVGTALQAALRGSGQGTAELDARLALGLARTAGLDAVTRIARRRPDTALQAALRARSDRMAALDAVIGLVVAAARSRTHKVSASRRHTIPKGNRSH